MCWSAGSLGLQRVTEAWGVLPDIGSSALILENDIVCCTLLQTVGGKDPSTAVVAEILDTHESDDSIYFDFCDDIVWRNPCHLPDYFDA